MRRLCIVVLALVICATASSSAAAADLYLAPTGANTGTCQNAAAPCSSFSYVQTQAGITPEPDTVHLAAGDYPTGARRLNQPDVAWVGPQAGVPGPGRSGSEARLLVANGAFGLGIQATGISIDGVTIQAADGASSTRGITMALPVTVSNVRFAQLSLGIEAFSALTIDNSDFVTTGDGIDVFDDGTPLVATGNAFREGTTGIDLNVGDGTATIARNWFSSNLATGVRNERDGVLAKNNFWGCNGGPLTSGCTAAVGLVVSEWLVLRSEVDPSVAAWGEDVEFRGTLRYNSSNDDLGPQFVGVPLTFTTTDGTFALASVEIGADGWASNTLTLPAETGHVTAFATLENAQASNGINVHPPVTANPAANDFATVAIGAGASTQAFTLTNNSATTISIRAISLVGSDPTDFVLWANGCRTTLAAGATCTGSATFRPTSAGAKSATISVLPDGGRDPVTIALTGTATSTPALAISPESGDYGTVRVGSSTKREFTITNTAGGPVDVRSVTLAGADAADFTLYAGACRNQTLAAGASCAISAFLRPNTAGSKSARISIAATGQAASAIDLSATVTS